jgi:hypothetical protein
MRLTERRVRKAFHAAGALDPGTAQGLDAIGIEDNRALRRLKRHDVVRESSPGCYYLDEETWAAVRSTRLKLALMLIAAVALVALVALYARIASS